MRSKTKEEALRIIHNSALAFKENLVHKNVLFLTTNDNGKPACFEAAFLPRNFMHLTGVQTKLSSVDFYDLAIRDRLREQDFFFTGDGTSDKKLDVLPTLMNIHITARMVGDYDYSNSLLVTDRFAGTVVSAMGFKKTRSIYIPNTALKTDIRDVVKRPAQRITAIFVKNKHDKKYFKLTYIAKGLTIDDEIIVSPLSDKVDFHNLIAAFPIPGK
jgi:hypothetical protein